MEHQCVAINKTGLKERCKRRGNVFENLCGVHHGVKCKFDALYKARFDAWIAAGSPATAAAPAAAAPAAAPAPHLNPILVHELPVAPVAVRRGAKKKAPEPAAAPAAPAAAGAAVPAAPAAAGAAALMARSFASAAARAAEAARASTDLLRKKRIAVRDKIMEGLSHPSTNDFGIYATRLYNLWKGESISGLDCIRAYIILKYRSIDEVDKIPHMIRLLKTVAAIWLLSNNNHPVHTTYASVPLEERTVALNAIHEALVPFGMIDIRYLLPSTDMHRKFIWRCLYVEEERIRAEADAVERAAAMERRRVFDIQLRAAPVVFARDPEGSIDLKSFATDNQNIHRSSVQTATQKAVVQLMKRTVDPTQDTLPEIIKDLQDPAKIRMSVAGFREKVIMEVQHDYYESVAFSVPYGDVMDRVWTFIRTHTNRADLFIRLAQEIAEGVGMCSNGKMARLVNVLQGFDETLLVEPPKEVFQDKIALVRKLPLPERGPAAKVLFEEFSIPEDERGVWVEALLETDEEKKAEAESEAESESESESEEEAEEEAEAEEELVEP